MQRKKAKWHQRWIMKTRLFLYDLRYCRKNRRAADSALHLLRDFNNTEGIKHMAEVTGLPEGVVAAAFKNVMWDEN
jgi:hypothetical protein